MLTHVISEWSYAISRARVGNMLAIMNEQYLSYMIIWVSVEFMKFQELGNLYSKPEQVLCNFSHRQTLLYKGLIVTSHVLISGETAFPEKPMADHLVTNNPLFEYTYNNKRVIHNLLTYRLSFSNPGRLAVTTNIKQLNCSTLTTKISGQPPLRDRQQNEKIMIT